MFVVSYLGKTGLFTYFLSEYCLLFSVYLFMFPNFLLNLEQMVIHTMSKVIKERASYENHKFPEGMPTGPWKSDVDAKMAINKYAHYHGFSVIFRTILLASNQKRGRRRHVCCDHFGFYKHFLHVATIDKQRNKCTKKCGCP